MDNATIAAGAREAYLLHIIAWIRDRAEQYKEESGCRTALEDLVQGLRDHEPNRAVSHGELDDLIREELKQEWWKQSKETTNA